MIDLAFLIDIAGPLNNFNITLQGNNKLTNMYVAITNFVGKLTLFKIYKEKFWTYFPTYVFKSTKSKLLIYKLRIINALSRNICQDFLKIINYLKIFV